MIWINGFMLLPALIGLFVLVQLARPKRPPMDESNRINHIILLWIALKSPEEFVGMYKKGHAEECFPFLKVDVKDWLGL